MAQGRRRAAAAKEPQTDERLTALGLGRGDEVRLRWKPGGKWQQAFVIGVNADGSLHLNVGGASRSVFPDRCEAKRRGPRGGVVWEPL